MQFELSIRQGRVSTSEPFLHLSDLFSDVLRLETHSYEARGEFLKAGHTGDNFEGQRRGERTGALQDTIEEAVSEHLHSLSVADGALSIVLETCQIVRCGGTGEQ